ncbi:MAG: hypothetical protein ACP5I7_07775 [Sulfolobales archaeon]
MIIFLPECFLNKCFAELLLEELKVRGRIIHKGFFGGDRILKELKSVSRRVYGDEKIILIIDIENWRTSRGIYVRNIFKEYDRVDKIHVMIGAEKIGGDRVVAVIFDPKPEEVFNLDLDESELKSEDACNKIKKTSRYSEIMNIANQIATLIRKKIIESTEDPKDLLTSSVVHGTKNIEIEIEELRQVALKEAEARVKDRWQ